MGHFEIGEEDCPPESGGQRDREADPARGGSRAANLHGCHFGTTPALRATPPDSGGVLAGTGLSPLSTGCSTCRIQRGEWSFGSA